MMNGLSDGRVCLRSHGQPPVPRRRVINCTRSSNERFCISRILRVVGWQYSVARDPPMSDQVLIVAAEPAARTPVDVATSLKFTPVVATSEQEAIALLDERAFTLIAVSGGTATWQRLRDAAEQKQPMARVL